jgi:hypothetical protein
MAQDIKYLRGTDSEAGAQRWIDRHGGGEKYRIDNTDINADGVPDVRIMDRAGNPVIVDGYTTTKSDHMVRKQYYEDTPMTEYEDKAGRQRTRLRIPYKDYLRTQYYSGEYDPQGRYQPTPEALQRFQEVKAKGYKVKKPRDRTPYQIFNTHIVSVCIGAVRDILRQHWETASISAPVRSKVAAYVYANLIVGPILRRKWGDEIMNAPEEVWKEAAKEKDLKPYIRDAVLWFLQAMDTPEKVHSLALATLHALIEFDDVEQYKQLYAELVENPGELFETLRSRYLGMQIPEEVEPQPQGPAGLELPNVDETFFT